MKKIVLTAAATLALGLAACGQSTTEAGNNATDVNATEIETGNDIDNAAIDVNSAAAVSATDNAIDDAGNALSTGASAVGNAATDTANTVSNAVD